MISINDIAKEAGVTKSTVSKVINNRPGLTKETREKVMKVIKKYDYQPSFFASHTSKKTKSNLIGVINGAFFGLEQIPYFPNLVSYIAVEARKTKRNTIIYLTDNSKEVVDVLKNTTSPIDGAIFINPHVNDMIINQLQKSDIPVVTIGTPDYKLNHNLSYCDTNLEETMHLFVDNIVKSGFEKPVLTDYIFDSTINRIRFDAYKESCKENHLEPKTCFFPLSNPDFKNHVSKLIDEGCDAIIVISTSFVKDAVEVIESKGLIVGKDVGIYALGYGFERKEDLENITYAEDDWAALGQAAVNLLNQMLDDKKKDDCVIVKSKIHFKEC